MPLSQLRRHSTRAVGTATGSTSHAQISLSLAPPYDQSVPAALSAASSITSRRSESSAMAWADGTVGIIRESPGETVCKTWRGAAPRGADAARL